MTTNNLALDLEKSKTILNYALECQNPYNLLLKEPSKNHIISVWKPDEKVHIVDILIARVIAAVAKIGCKCTIYFSNCLTNKDFIEDEKRHNYARFCMSFYKELYNQYCGDDRISLKRLLPFEMGLSESESFRKISIEYNKLKDEINQIEVLDREEKGIKEWFFDPFYPQELISFIANYIEQNENYNVYILCRLKHKNIWENLVCRVLKMAKLPFPQIIYVKNVERLSTGNDIFHDRDNDCLWISQGQNEILRHISKVKDLRDNKCIEKILNWLCFPTGITLNIEDKKIFTFERWAKVNCDKKELCAETSRIIYDCLRPIRDSQERHQRMFAPVGPTKITNRFIVNIVESKLRFGNDPFEEGDQHWISENTQNIDQLNIHPDKYKNSYMEAGEIVLNSLKIKQDDKNKLKNIWLDCKGIDRLSTLFNKRHRDHFSHQFNVYGLGMLLLQSKVIERDNNNSFANWVKDNLKFDNIDQVYDAWAIASLFHDHAYPLGYLLILQPRMGILLENEDEKKALTSLYEAIQNVVPEIFNPQLWPTTYSFNEKIVELVDKFCIKMNIMYGNKNKGENNSFSTDSKYVDHGLLGAVNLDSKLQKGELSTVHKTALEAIALHNRDQVLDFSTEPLAALLYLCDELHEWGRPVVTNKGVVCPVEQITLNLQKDIDGYVKMPKCLEVEFHCRSRSYLEYADWDDNSFWNSKQESLEKIRLSNDIFPKEIEMYFRTPSRVIKA